MVILSTPDNLQHNQASELTVGVKLEYVDLAKEDIDEPSKNTTINTNQGSH